MLPIVLGLAIASVGLAPADAHAQAETSARDEARELGKAALERWDARDYAQAEALFSQAIAAYDAPTLRLGRARASVQLGHWIAAAEDYRTAISAAPEPGEPAAFVEARSAAKVELAELLPRIPRLTVLIAGAERPAVSVDGRGWTSLSEPQSVDPGTHRVAAAFASGAVEEEVTVAEGGSARVELRPKSAGPSVTPGALSVAGAAPTKAPASAPSGDAKRSAADKSSVAESSSSTATTIGLIATGALAVAAVVTGVVTLQKRADYKKHNTPDESMATKRNLRSSVVTWSWINTGLTAGAVVGAGVTTYLWLRPTASEPQTGSLGTGFDGVSFGVSGTF